MSVANKFETFTGSEIELYVEFMFRDPDGRNVYSYTVRRKSDDKCLLAGESLRSGCWTQDEPDCKEMLSTLSSFLQPGNGDYGSPAEAEFASQYGETLWMEVQDSFLGFHQLPGVGSVEIFYRYKSSPHVDQDGEWPADGIYWQACFPGCLPDGDPMGPFDTPFNAYEDWKRMD